MKPGIQTLKRLIFEDGYPLDLDNLNFLVAPFFFDNLAFHAYALTKVIVKINTRVCTLEIVTWLAASRNEEAVRSRRRVEKYPYVVNITLRSIPCFLFNAGSELLSGFFSLPLELLYVIFVALDGFLSLP